MAHYAGRFEESKLQTPLAYKSHSQGYIQTSLIDHTVGSVHTGTNICQLAPQGVLTPHFHSYEEGFYILEGEMLVSIDGQAYQLKSGDFGTISVGQIHAWRNISSKPVRWFQAAAPQPKPEGKERDTYFLKSDSVPNEAKLLDPNDPGGNLLGHFDFGQIPAPGEEGRVGSGALEGIFLKWMNDENLGAHHHRLFMLEYQRGVKLALHDHPFEESYFVVKGEVEAILGGERYIAKAGDVLWTGVGCVHAFANISDEPVIWLETMAPQPPVEHGFRFMDQWEAKAEELGAA